MKHVIKDNNDIVINPVSELGYSSGNMFASLVRSDAEIAYKIDENGKLCVLYRTDHTIENLQDIARKFGLIGQNVNVTNKSDVYEKMKAKAFDANDPESVTVGNVDLYTPSDGIRRAVRNNVVTDYEEGSWEIPEWPLDYGYQTVYPQVMPCENKYVVATPINASGNATTPAALETYIGTCLQQQDPMSYDSAHNKLIIGIADSEDEAKALIELIREWEDYAMSASIPESGEGKTLYDKILSAGWENQDATVENICEAAGIGKNEVVAAVNEIYPVFKTEDSYIAYGHLMRLLFHELWIAAPRSNP